MKAIKTSSVWKGLLSSRGKLIIGGAIIGILAALLTNWGNPLNKGLTVTCFIRDITGALGLQQSSAAQYIRPEIIGMVLGAFITALIFKDYKARGGSSPLIRFFLGFFVMVGAEVFLACPAHALLRLAGGDLNALTGLAGLILGVIVGVIFLKMRFSLGRNNRTNSVVGLVTPFFAVVLLLLLVVKPEFISFSTIGSASHHAPLWISLVAGLAVGFLSQRTRLCFMAGWRDIFWIKNTEFFGGIAAFFLAALFTNYVVGNFAADGVYHWGFTSQPYAMDNQLWNFTSMALVGLGTTLLGGCPLRQTILSGEGDSDAAMVILGFFAGAPIAQNFLIKSNDVTFGVNKNGPLAVLIGLAFCITIGFAMREKS
jgi:hypothetical protein